MSTGNVEEFRDVAAIKLIFTQPRWKLPSIRESIADTTTKLEAFLACGMHMVVDPTDNNQNGQCPELQ
ncbi:hypothetical protein IFR04_013995, partial [Cadophora malorum]